MKLPGLIGERLYSVFSKNKGEYLDWKEFLSGCNRLFSQTFEDKLKLVFDIFDTDSNQLLTQDEFQKILSHIPIEFVFLVKLNIDTKK